MTDRQCVGGHINHKNLHNGLYTTVAMAARLDQGGALLLLAENIATLDAHQCMCTWVLLEQSRIHAKDPDNYSLVS